MFHYWLCEEALSCLQSKVAICGKPTQEQCLGEWTAVIWLFCSIQSYPIYVCIFVLIATLFKNIIIIFHCWLILLYWPYSKLHVVVLCWRKFWHKNYAFHTQFNNHCLKCSLNVRKMSADFNPYRLEIRLTDQWPKCACLSHNWPRFRARNKPNWCVLIWEQNVKVWCLHVNVMRPFRINIRTPVLWSMIKPWLTYLLMID